MFRYTLIGCSAAIVLSSCSASQAPAVPAGRLASSITALRAQSGAETPHYRVTGPLLFATNFDGPVTVYDAVANNPRPIVTIHKGINQIAGACVDREGTLYVLSEFDGVSEYTLGTTKPFRKITEGIGQPSFCAIDPRGNLWVTNLSPANVSEYLKGASKPHFRITRGLVYPDGIAIDQAGNIYVGNLQPYASSNVQVYRRGKKRPFRTITDGVVWPVGIAIDPKGNLYVTNDHAPCNVEVYLPGQSHPYQTITVGIDGPTDVAFARNGRMYVVNEGGVGCTSSRKVPAINEFAPGGRTLLKRDITKALHNPLGVAYYPPALP
jgi:hypothetical protein